LVRKGIRVEDKENRYGEKRKAKEARKNLE